MTALSTAVVVCAYTLERWDDLVESLSSAAAQSPAPDELWLVVDHNPALLERASVELTGLLPGLNVVANHRQKGLSGARNTAVERVRKSAAPRADISPDGLPPVVNPPPSDRCIRITVTSSAAMMAWTTSRKVKIMRVGAPLMGGERRRT